MGNLGHTPAEYAEMWTSWHDNVGAPMKDDYAKMVGIANEGAKELGFSDTGAMWRSGYDMSPEEFAKTTERLWQEVKPLYMALHTRSEEHTSELQPLMRISSAVLCWTNKTHQDPIPGHYPLALT